MGTTPTYALPYPELTDTADVPRDVKALADKVDGLLQPKLVTALPGAPVDGQEIYYQSAAMATDGIAWHLRYRAASASAYKWELVGGAPLVNEVLSSEALAGWVSSAAFSGISANDPNVTVPLAGDYEATTVVSLSLNAAGATFALGVKVGATEPIANTNSTNGYAATASTWVPLAHMRRLTGVAAAVKIQQRYVQNSGSTGTLTRIGAHLAVTPIRVG